jgi:hypothetical protein
MRSCSKRPGCTGEDLGLANRCTARYPTPLVLPAPRLVCVAPPSRTTRVRRSRSLHKRWRSGAVFKSVSSGSKSAASANGDFELARDPGPAKGRSKHQLAPPLQFTGQAQELDAVTGSWLSEAKRKAVTATRPFREGSWGSKWTTRGADDRRIVGKPTSSSKNEAGWHECRRYFPLVQHSRPFLLPQFLTPPPPLNQRGCVGARLRRAEFQ